ncbi:HD domain-containing protein [Candidatus Roizmanbacteria bacterium]|nr:HD domain-containing protein [Candidatus Roizmanbacteria bacterium]
MGPINIIGIIQEAQKRLVLMPIDIVHDVTHHYRVYENAIKILEHEKLKINDSIVTICAWLHDIEDRKGKKNDQIAKILEKYCVPLYDRKRIINIINEHTYGKKQSLLESKIIFDADKIEYVNAFRITSLKTAYQNKYIDNITYQRYLQEWKERTFNLQNYLHFSYSKSLYLKQYPTARRMLFGKLK